MLAPGSRSGDSDIDYKRNRLQKGRGHHLARGPEATHPRSMKSWGCQASESHRWVAKASSHPSEPSQAGARTTTELCPPIPSEDLTVSPASAGVKPSSSRG